MSSERLPLNTLNEHELNREGNDDELEIPPTVCSYNNKNFQVSKRCVIGVLVGLLILSVVFLWYFATIKSAVTISERVIRDKTVDEDKNINVDQSAHHMHLSAGAKDIRQCRKEETTSIDFRKTFPDIDYAMLGYDIIKGYPDANSHDPGFTYPIFIANYSDDRLTSDCRYSIPKGFIVIPDVSCVTSFASSIIRNSLELQKSLAVSVQIGGGYAGFSFSASASYKKTSSQVSSGEKVFITSSAKCSYYFSKVDPIQPPPLNPGFLLWVKYLERDTSDENLIQFVKNYGTHFPTGIVFGARYVRKYSMTTESFRTASSRDVSVSAQASYSGLLSVSGSFSLDKNESEAASEFNKDVETTTVSVGAAPPSNGDALHWAASVKENPVPTSYKLKPIADLFTPIYMKGTGINYNLIRWKLKGIEKKYFNHLLNEGSVHSCNDAIRIGIRIPDHELRKAKHPFWLKVPESSCISKCFDDQFCLSITYEQKTSICTFHDGATELRRVQGNEPNSAEVLIFPSRISDLKKSLEVSRLEVVDEERAGSKSTNNATTCRELCLKDSACDIFSFSVTHSRTKNCKLYASKSVKKLQFSELEEKKVTYFIYREKN